MDYRANPRIFSGPPLKPNQIVIGFYDANQMKPAEVVIAQADAEGALPHAVVDAPLVMAGWHPLVMDGKALINSPKNHKPHPRTAFGLTEDRRTLICMVIDGRQPGYSGGVTLSELARLMLDAGAFQAVNMDGGGSSTLAIRQPMHPRARLLNSPIHNGIPGKQRPQASFLGIRFSHPPSPKTSKHD